MPATAQPIATPGARLTSVDGRAYPLAAARIEARVHGGIAVTTLSQTFRNPYSEPLEVLYALPLPADGAVVAYTVRFGKRTITGEIRPRSEARREYEEALFEGRAAALLEQDRDDTFRQRLGSLPAGVDAEVEIRVLHPVEFVPADGQAAALWEYRFPTVVGVRYAGEPGRVADAGRLEVDRAPAGDIPTRFDVRLVVADGAPAALACASPSHRLAIAGDESETTISLLEEDRLDRDLVVRWAACEEAVGVRWFEGPGLPGDDGRYALLTLTPPPHAGSGVARDLTLLIDASGSMTGDPIRWAREVAIATLRALAPGDRFEVLAFSSAPRRLTRKMVSATPDAVAAAVAAVERLEAGGGTEMADAIVEALRPLRADGQRQVVLVTDGCIGFEREVVERIADGLPAGCRVHTVGIGPAPNRSLTRYAALAGRGVEVLIDADGDVPRAVGRLHRATARPVLVDLAIAGSAFAAPPPGVARDVLAGRPSTLPVELTEEGGVIEIRGRNAGGEPWVRCIEVPARGTARAGELPIGALYGRVAIADRELRAAAQGSWGADVDAEVEALAMRHRIPSRTTSLVAVASEPTVDPRAPRRRERLPVEVPRGLSAEMLGLDSSTLGRGIDPMLPEAAMDATLEGRSIERRALRLPKRAPRVSMSWRWFRRERPRTAIEGRIVSVGDDRLVIEFEVPEDGFELPDEFEVVLDDREVVHAWLDREDSSPRGPHARGLIVRMALQWAASVPTHRIRGVKVRLDRQYEVVASLDLAEESR